MLFITAVFTFSWYSKTLMELNLQSVRTVGAFQSQTIRSKSNLFANHTEIMRRQQEGAPHVRFIAFGMRSNCVAPRMENPKTPYTVSRIPNPDPLATPSITIKVVNAPQSPADNGWMALVRSSIFVHSIPLVFYFIYLFRSPLVHPPKHLNKNKIFILCSQYVVNLVAAADETKRN